jgi:hydroxypyruvate isomerase
VIDVKLSVCLETFYPDSDLTTRVARLRRHGIHNFELWDSRTYGRTQLTQVIGGGAGSSLQLFCGNRQFSPTDPNQRSEFLEELDTNVRLAADLGCPTVTILSDAVDARGIPIPSQHGCSKREKLDHLHDALVAAIPIAAAAHVRMLLEPLNSTIDHPGITLDQSKAAFEIVRAVASPWLSILFDVYHMQVMEGCLVEAMEANLDVIGHVHVADVPGRCEPGQGAIDFQRIISLLSVLCYDGFVGLECCPISSSDDAVAAFIRQFPPTKSRSLSDNLCDAERLELLG